MKGDSKKQYIFNSNFGLYFNRQKKYKIQSKNIIMCNEFDAKVHLFLALKISNNFDIERQC